MSRLFRSLTLSSGSHLNRDGGVGGASGSDAPDGIGTASLTPALGLGDEDDDSDWLDAGFASDDHHLMAVYHFANVLAFEFGHDKAKETIVGDLIAFFDALLNMFCFRSATSATVSAP